MKDESAHRTEMQIRILRNGPYVVTSGVPLTRQRIVCDADGESIAWREGEPFPVGETYSLCRCGATRTRPFCDGTHARVGFDGTETASRVPYLERADWIEGAGIRLSDAPGFCSHARFCVRGAGIWDLVEQSGDPEARRTALAMAANCHSGRLVVWDRESGAPIEPVFEPSIAVVEEPDGRLGPLWVRGRIPVISADGTAYEVRNRVTLCRCGRSENKPFCDGTHQHP